MAMRELTDDQKKAATDLLKLSGEELRWRMEKVVQISAACSPPPSEAAIELNNALHLLEQGTSVKPKD